MKHKSFLKFGVIVLFYPDIPKVGKRIKTNTFKS